SKTITLGIADANPDLVDLAIDGAPLDALQDVFVARRVDVHFSVAADIDDDVNWLTNVGEMDDYDLPQSYLRVEDDEDRVDGQLVVVRRDARGGVVWRVWRLQTDTIGSG